MKKTYITPMLEVVKIQPVNLLAGSDPDAIIFDGIDGLDGYGGIDDGTADPS